MKNQKKIEIDSIPLPSDVQDTFVSVSFIDSQKQELVVLDFNSFKQAMASVLVGTLTIEEFQQLLNESQENKLKN
jgi:hypothetical protein